jgi:hypothetical protein
MVLDEFDLRLERKRGLEVSRKIIAEKSSCPGLIGLHNFVVRLEIFAVAGKPLSPRNTEGYPWQGAG